MNSEPTTEQKNKKQKLIIILLIIGIVICIGVTIWALFFRDGDTTTDYPPKGIEAGQLPLEDDNSNKLDSPEGGGAINVTFGTTATVSLSDKTVTLYYANPNASNQDVSVLIMVEDLVVAQSDLINPGNYINELKLTDKAKSALQEGVYNAELVIRAHNPDSGEKAMVDTKGELTLNVAN